MSKYIDVEKLIAEIKRLKNHAECSKNEWINEGYNQNAFAEDCRIDSFDKLLSFIDSLQQEQTSLPDNLDEAAEKFARLYDNGTCDGIAQDCFNAGANWQKEQTPGTTTDNPINPFDTKLFQDGVKEGRRLEREEKQQN